jgi:uncharacterized protein
MRKLFFIVFALALTAGTATAQTMPLDTAGFKTFSYQEGDTSYLMKQYIMCFYKKGESREQTETEAQDIQAAHLAHLGELTKTGKLCMAGPFGDDGDLRGILVLNVRTMEEAEALVKQDPAVRAGRLTYELHPWWAAVGTRLY